VRMSTIIVIGECIEVGGIVNACRVPRIRRFCCERGEAAVWRGVLRLS
jgi:hypothetical protein